MADPLPLAQALIRCASVTPADAGAQDVLAGALERLGFTVTRLRFGAIENLFARARHRRAASLLRRPYRRGAGGRGGWRADPFAGEVRDGVLYGRGACDMKGAIAAFVAAVRRSSAAGPPRGSISLLITGDEEGAGRRRHRARAGLDGRRTARCRISAWSASRPTRRGSAR